MAIPEDPPSDTTSQWVVITSTNLPYLSHSGAGTITLNQSDLEQFKENAWFSDKLMDFGLNFWMKRHVLSPQSNLKIWIFSTFFYTALVNNSPVEIRRWTTDVDIFTFDFIVVPVYLRAERHWMAVIIVKPGLTISTVPDEKRCYILSMDSISSQRCDVHLNVTKWVQGEAKRNHPHWPWSEPECQELKVPQQMNTGDCGPYTLYNISRFIRHYEEITEVFNGRGTLLSERYHDIWREDLAVHYRSVLRGSAKSHIYLSKPVLSGSNVSGVMFKDMEISADSD